MKTIKYIFAILFLSFSFMAASDDNDDVIDTELLLIFGGSAGTSNPGLTSDKVGSNDKAFLSVFPYLAAPW